MHDKGNGRSKEPIPFRRGKFAAIHISTAFVG